MIIKEDATGNEYDVYGMYWYDNITHFYILSRPGEYGMIAITEKKCEIIEHSIDNFVAVEIDGNKSFFLHRAAYEGNLYEELIEHMPEAVTEFNRRLAEYK